MNEQLNFLETLFPEGTSWTKPSVVRELDYMDFRLRVKKLHEDAVIPSKANPGDLGYDLYALEDTVVLPGVVTKVRTGIACNFPVGFGALIRDRSSVATKREIFTVAGVIDNGYTGEIIVAFFNPGWPQIVQLANQDDIDQMRASASGVSLVTEDGLIAIFGGPESIKKGDKIAQMVLHPAYTVTVAQVDELTTTERGTNGFGSSGA